MAYFKGLCFRVKNIWTAAIPALSFAEISSQFNSSLHYFPVTRPGEDNLVWSKIVMIPEEIPVGKFGIGYFGGLGVVKKTSGTFSFGDKVGTEADAFTAKAISDDSLGNNDGQFVVLGIYGTTSENLIIRPRTRENLVAFTN